MARDFVEKTCFRFTPRKSSLFLLDFIDDVSASFCMFDVILTELV